MDQTQDAGDDDVAAIIDVVRSREHPDQGVLLRTTAAQVALWSEQRPGLDAGPTVGDELQATWHATPLPRVLHDVALLRLQLASPVGDGPVVDVRVGIGVGEIVRSTGDGAAAPAQSGSAWWNARSAVERVNEARNGWPDQRWWIEGDNVDPATSALLVALDTIMLAFDAKDRWSALRLVEGRSARQIAAELGVTDSTMSSRLHGHGVYGWWRTMQQLKAAS